MNLLAQMLQNISQLLSKCWNMKNKHMKCTKMHLVGLKYFAQLFVGKFHVFLFQMPSNKSGIPNLYSPHHDVLIIRKRKKGSVQANAWLGSLTYFSYIQHQTKRKIIYTYLNYAIQTIGQTVDTDQQRKLSSTFLLAKYSDLVGWSRMVLSHPYSFA